MSKENDFAQHIICSGKLIMLRRWLEKDRQPFARWQTQGEWLLFDAPWEESVRDENLDQEQTTKQTNRRDGIWFRNQAIIATPDNIPLGWVNHYGGQKNPDVRFVGIDICEDKFLNLGMGTEALQLWVDHLFGNSGIHKLCLDTWSFNPRMVRVAEKVGFGYEGCQREMQYWNGKWLDLLHFGILREEWKRYRQPG